MLWIEFGILTWQATFGSIIFSLFLLNLHGRLNMVKTCRQSYKKIWVLSEAANSSNIEKLLKILATKNYKSKVQSEKEERKAYIIQLFPEREVNGGGYIPRGEASMYISTALHRP